MRSVVVPTNRLIEPSDTVRRDVERRQGIRGQAAIERRIDRTARAGEPPMPVITTDALSWYRANVGASGDAAYLGRVGVPSSDSAWAMANVPLLLPMAGRVLGGYLWSSEARTAGTCQLRIRLVDPNRTTDLDFPGLVLSGAFPQSGAARLPWEKCGSYAFAPNTTIEARFVTAGSWAPTSADVGALIVVAFAEP